MGLCTSKPKEPQQVPQQRPQQKQQTKPQQTKPFKTKEEHAAEAEEDSQKRDVEYQKYEKIVSEHAKKRAEYFEQSKKAYENKNGALAKELSVSSVFKYFLIKWRSHGY